MQKFFIFIIVIVLMGGCSANVQNSVDAEQVQGEHMYKVNATDQQNPTYKILAKGVVPKDEVLYMDAKAQTKIFYCDNPKQKEAFFHLYERLTGKTASDFDGVAIVALEGTKSTGGYKIEVEKIEDRVSTIDLRLIYRTPPKGSIVTQAFTSPYLVLLIPHTHKEVKVFVSEE